MKNYLIHYGVKGMKWGVRKDKKSKKFSFSDGIDSIRNNSQYTKTNFPIFLKPKEYGRVMSSFLSNSSKEKLKKRTSHFYYGNYRYTMEKFDDDDGDIYYKITDKQQIPNTKTGLMPRDFNKKEE